MNRLLKYREKQNLTQEELAEKAGVSTRTIQRIEKGAVPKGYTLKVLAKALAISENELQENEVTVAAKNTDYQLIKYINLSSILGVILPPINILLPWVLMKYKDQENEITKQIVSIQILYTIIAVSCILISPFISRWFNISKQLTVGLIIASILVDLYIIIRNTIALDKNQQLRIQLNFSFI